MNKNERVGQLRQQLGLTLQAFADQIGYTNGTISSIEKGRTAVERRFVVALRLAFGVREEWILDGEGPIFLDPEDVDESELIAVIGKKYALSEDSLYILRGYLRLSPDDKNILAALIKRLAETPAPQKNPSEMVPEAENLRKIG